MAKKIDLGSSCGKHTITRSDGKKIAAIIKQELDGNEDIVIDFNNILIASVSFFDEAFGKLAFEYPKEVLVKKLTFANIEKYDRALLNDILISRYHQKEMGLNGFSRKRKKN